MAIWLTLAVQWVPVEATPEGYTIHATAGPVAYVQRGDLYCWRR